MGGERAGHGRVSNPERVRFNGICARLHRVLYTVLDMTKDDIADYYDVTEHKPVRSDLIYAVGIVDGEKTAVDCGCGAGADIAYLLGRGFTVHAFDVEAESISRCRTRFQDSEAVFLSESGFSGYRFPDASLVVAEASLFFCAAAEFDQVWSRIDACLGAGGVFCGSFLGPDDTMAEQTYGRGALWPEVLVLNENQVRERFGRYRMHRFTEHRQSGTTHTGAAHNWHIFSVVAKKLS